MSDKVRSPKVIYDLTFEDLMNIIPGFISGSTLKLIAVITMFIDHVGGGVLYAMLVYGVYPEGTDFDSLYKVYRVFRAIGRQAFPIYCFLLVEGLIFTSSRIRYLMSLLLFALISELPFDLALECPAPYMYSSDVPDILANCMPDLMTHQNVFLTLAIGLACCWIIDGLYRRFGLQMITFLGAGGAAFGAYFLAERLITDYRGYGIEIIVAFYLLRRYRIPALACGYLLLLQCYNEQWSLAAFILLAFYNGERGFIKGSPAVKYFFYLFYPLHLILVFLIRILILQGAL